MPRYIFQMNERKSLTHASGAKAMRAAFSLMEIAIVIAIIALLAGGVTVAQSMSRSAQIKNILNGAARYERAILQFKTQYNYMPGDMPNATVYFGTDTTTGTCPNNAPGGVSVDTLGTATCNGDGDGKTDNRAATFEQYRLWQQLSAAKLIEGMYSGHQPAACNSLTGSTHLTMAGLGTGGIGCYAWCISGVNCPATSIPNVSYMFQHMSFLHWKNQVQFFGNGTTGSPAWRDGPMLIVGGDEWDYNARGWLLVSEIQAIDLKFDDNRPAWGKITSSAQCANNHSPSAVQSPLTAKYMPNTDVNYDKSGCEPLTLITKTCMCTLGYWISAK